MDVSLKGFAVTQLIPSPHDILEDSDRLITVLERYRTELPFVDEELALHQTLHDTLEMQQQASDCTLAEWRQALAQRWECEIAGHRSYLDIKRQLGDFFGADSPHIQVITPTERENARTAAELLVDLRRLEASLRLMQPCPACIGEKLRHLSTVCANLEAALARTRACESQRHTAMLEQRLAQQAYERARSQTQRLLARHLGEQVPAELSQVWSY